MNRFVMGLAALMFSPVAALAADIPVQIEYATAPAAETYNWSGIYAGGQLGWGNGGHDLGLASDCGEKKRHCFPGAGLSGLDATNDVIGGLRAGVDWQIGQFILGAFGVYNWDGGFDTDGNIGDFVAIHGELGEVWAINGKVGYSPANIDRMQVYVFGGYAATDVTGSLRIGDDSISRSVDMDGFDVGLGIEFAMMDNVTFFLEGAHYDFGSENFGVSGLSVDTTLDTVQAGVNIRFGGTPIRNMFAR